METYLYVTFYILISIAWPFVAIWSGLVSDEEYEYILSLSGKSKEQLDKEAKEDGGFFNLTIL